MTERRARSGTAPLPTQTLRSARRLGIVVVLLLSLALPAQSGGAPRTATGQQLAASFDLPTANGRISLDALRSKVVLVDFWASWCVPCRQSFPWMNSLAQRYGPQGLVVVAIDVDKDRQDANQFLRELSPSFAVAFDPEGRTADAFAVRTMPSSYLVDREGQVAYTHRGFDPKDAAAFEQRIKEEVLK